MLESGVGIVGEKEGATTQFSFVLKRTSCSLFSPPVCCIGCLLFDRSGLVVGYSTSVLLLCH